MIDWVTVGAQIVNFVILVVLLKIFLYDRVLAAMDKRKAKIEDRFEEARRRESEAENEARQYRQKQRELEDRREQLLQQARDDAEKFGRQRRSQAEQEVNEQKRQWLQAAQEQRADFLSNLRRQTARQLGNVTRKVLADVADADLQQQVVAEFLRRLSDLDEEARRELREALAGGRPTIEVAAAFDVADDQAGQIRDAVQDLCGYGTDIRFVRNGDLLCGVQLRAGGRAVGWNMAEYVDEIIGQIGEAIDEQIRTLRDEGHPQAQQEQERGADSQARQNSESGEGDQKGRPQSDAEGGQDSGAR